jgi:hypothetical protein
MCITFIAIGSYGRPIEGGLSQQVQAVWLAPSSCHNGGGRPLAHETLGSIRVNNSPGPIPTDVSAASAAPANMISQHLVCVAAFFPSGPAAVFVVKAMK